MSDLKFKASADLTQIRADLARLKTDLSALTTEIKINRTALQADITHAKSMITSQLTAVAHTVRVSVVADAARLAADIAAIRGVITTQLSSTITGVNHQLKFVVNIPLLNASLARAEAIIRAWIARIGAMPISVSTGSFETTMRRAALLISRAVRDLTTEISALRGQLTTLGGTSAASAAQIQTLQRQIDSLRTELERMRNSAGTAQNSVSSLTSMIRSLAASIGGIAGLTMFMRITDEAKKFESQLRLVTASQQELIAVQTALFNLSNETGTAMESSRFKGDTLYGTVRMMLDDVNDHPAESAADTYRGYPVLTAPSDWTADLTVDYMRKMQTVDFGVGGVYRDDESGQPALISSHHWTLDSRANIAAFRSFLYARRGRLSAVWLPSFLSDLSLAAPITSSATQISIEHCKYTDLYNLKRNRRDIRIELTSGVVLYRRITACTEISGTIEQLTLNAALGVDVGISDIERISFMAFSRLDADAIELAWRWGDLVEAKMNWRTTNDDV